MYKTICIAVDNSDYSNQAIEIGVMLAKEMGATVYGSHVYAAKLHDKRFKQMEAGLPEEYHDEKELERQRRIHETLITQGLSLITDSYLDVVDQKCRNENLPFERKSLEGRNFKVLVEDIEKEKYGLVLLGSLGMGAVRHSTIGSVCERTIRRTRSSDILVVKNTEPLNGKNRKIVVAVDGSPYSFGGLKTALSLGRVLGMEVEAVSAFDPYFHYAAFNSIADVLSEEAGKVFRFKEQEKLHEEIIDSGLAKIYQAHLDISRDVAKDEGMQIATALLDGKPFEKIMQYVKKENPWLLIVGRIGVHSEEDMDIGSNTENLLRGVPCNVLISNRTFVPPIDTVAEYSIAWTEEALRRMDKVPSFARGVAKTAVHRYAVERGHTIISNSVIDSALGHILPESAMKAMMGVTKALAEKKADQEMEKASAGTREEQVSSGQPVLSYQERLDQLDHFMCQACGHLVRGEQPVKCSICSADGTSFEKIDRAAILSAVESEGGVETEKAYDDVTLEWTSEARARLREVGSGYMRRRAKAVIEKRARKMGLRTITVEMASKAILEYADEVRWKDEMLVGENLRAESTSASAEPALKPDDVGRLKQSGADNVLEWSPEALQRLERVPAGYMRDSTRGTVEKHAREKGIAAVTLQVCEEGIEKAKVIMEEAMKNPQAMEELLKNLGKKE